MIAWALSLAVSGCSTQYVAVGQNWQALYNAPNGEAANVTLSSPKDTYKIGELMSFSVESNKPGKLWLITVGPEDKPELIFPNALVKDNSIEPSKKITLPGEMESWKMRAAEPLGRNLVVAMVTGRDATLQDINEFLLGAGLKNKSISFEKGSIKYGLDKKVVTIER